MIDEIVCIGTSFTNGGGLHTFVNQDVVRKYKDKGIEVNSIKSSFPYLIEQKTKIKTTNKGKSGSGVEYLIRNVEEYFNSNQEIKNKIFILEYASYGRSEIYSNKHQKYLVANWSTDENNSNEYAASLTIDYENEPETNFDSERKIYENYLNKFQNEKNELIKRDLNFLNLLYKLKYYNILFYVICLDNPFFDKIEKDIVFNESLIKFYSNNNLVDLQTFVQINNLRIMDDIEDNVDGHPSPKGHDIISDIILNRLKEDGKI